MSFKNLLTATILLLSILSINGCIAPGGDECKYDSFKTYAVVKEIKKDHVILDLSTKYTPYSDQKYKEITVRLPPVHVGERIPMYVDQINQGACAPIGYRVDRNYFRMKNNHTSVLVDDD